jgi:hypothetical protein
MQMDSRDGGRRAFFAALQPGEGEFSYSGMAAGPGQFPAVK